MLWFVVAALVLALLAWLLLASWRLELSLTGRGEPSGAWVLGGGARVGVITLSCALARGIAPQLQAHVFGRRVWRRAPAQREPGGEPPEAAKRAEPAEASEQAAKEPEWRSRIQAMALRALRTLEPAEVLVYLLEQRRRLRLEVLSLTLSYSFEDVLLTGRLMAAVYAVRWALPPPIQIDQVVRWELVDRAAATLTFKARVWPGRLLLATLGLFIRSGWRRLSARCSPPLAGELDSPRDAS